MSIKLFSGIGTVSHPFDVEGQASSATVQATPFFGTSNATIVVDHAATPVLGNMNIPSMIGRVFPSIPNAQTNVSNRSLVPSPLSSGPSQRHPGAPSTVTVTPTTVPQVESQTSGPASYDTVFHDFHLTVHPVYNFWTADELTNDSQDVGDRKLEDVPRYHRVTWAPAPDLAVRYDMTPKPGQKQKTNSPVMLGNEIQRPVTVVYKGASFSPQHLNDFQLVKRSLANGFVSPGTVHAVVELPGSTSGVTPPVSSVEPYAHLDEDAFLQHPDFQGLSLAEAQANIDSLTNGALYAGQIDAQALSTAASTARSALFSGKFSVSKPPTNGGLMDLAGVHASSPALGVQVRTALATEQTSVAADPLLKEVQKVQAPAPVILATPSTQTRVKFVTPSLGGLLDPAKVNAIQRPEHAESTTALAQVLPNLEVMNAAGLQNQPRQISVPGFPSPPNLPFLQYAGYVLEKYQQNANGTFVLQETIDLPNPAYDTYIDSKVCYAKVYRYRIRAIIRWTRPSSMGVEGPDKTIDANHVSQTKAYAFYRSSYFQGDWSKTWAYGSVLDFVPPSPPDEMTVRPDSARKQVTVTFKLPSNEQRDIYYMRLFRKLQDQDGRDMTGWVQVGSQWGPENVMYVDTDVDYFQANHVRYAYAAQTVTRHGEYSTLSDQLATRLNQEFLSHGEYGVDFVSQAGVRLELHGAFSTYPFRRSQTEVVVPNDVRFVFSGRKATGNIALAGNQYYVRVESLDTGETRDYPVEIVYNNQPTRVNRKTGLAVGAGTGARKGLKVGQNTTPAPVFRDWKPQNPLPRTLLGGKAQPKNGLGPTGTGG